MGSIRSSLPRVAVLALGWGFAALVPACGGNVVVDGTSTADAGPVCAARETGGSITENCHRYCSVYADCLGCASTAAACEMACNVDSLSPTEPTVDACLACAVGHIHELVDQLACTDAYGPQPGVLNLFKLTYATDECPVCTHPH